MSQTQDRVRQQIDLRSTQAGEQISTQAADLRSVSDALREKGQDGPAQMADRLAGYAEQAGSYLSEKNVGHHSQRQPKTSAAAARVP